jgi:biopolymer transport protein ExbD
MKVQTDSEPYDSINVTPMLDLAYVLLVVFILMTTATVQGVTLAMPKPSATPPAERFEVLVLRVESDGTFKLNGAPRSLESLRAELAAVKAREPRATVVIQGDGKAAYQRVVAMIDLVNELELGLSLATSRIGF